MYNNKHKVVLLPTANKGSIDITLGNDGILNINHPHQTTYQALYILSDDGIRKDDWIYNSFSKVLGQALFDETKKDPHLFKVIATTNNTIYPKCDGHCAECVCTYPQPTKEFIQHFVSEYNKGNLITDVEVEYLNLEPNNGGLILKVNQDNTINIKLPIAQDTIDDLFFNFATYYNGNKYLMGEEDFVAAIKELIKAQEQTPQTTNNNLNH